MSGFVYGVPREVYAPPRVRSRRVVPALAAAAGHVLRVGRRAAVHIPGVAGAAAIAGGAWLAWPPAGLVVAGLFLLLLDRRMP